jgi:hypothetical protein
MDLYLSHNISEEMNEEELLYLLIGFFLIASKFKETDIFEPELYIFCNIDFDYALSVEKILFYEAKCLQLIGYDFFIYSTYDWLSIFMGNGYIFDGEIDNNNNEIINDIHSYSFKLLITITPKNIFIKYSPMYNAISIVQICREDKIDKNRINNELFNKLLFIYNIKYKDYENCYNEIKSVINKTNENNNNQNNQIRTLKRTEDNKTLNEMNYYEPEVNKSGKKIIKFDTQRKLNLKNKIRDNKFQLNLFSSNRKPKKRFGSINITNINNKSRGIIKKQKTLQIVEFINDNLPKLKKITEGDKVFQTEAEVASGRNIKIYNVKNNILNNYLMKKKKNRSGASLDIKMVYNNAKSPLAFNRLLRNVTYDALKNNDIKITKKLSKDNNMNNNKNKSKLLNKSSDALKYYDSNTNNNIKNNNIIFELKKSSNNNIKSKGKKPFIKQGTSDYLQSNNIKIIKPEKSNILSNNKKEKEKEITKNIESNKQVKKKNPSTAKYKDKNNQIINNSNRNKFILSNMKYNKSNLNNINDLLALKKMIFKNQRLPRLKLNIDKK